MANDVATLPLDPDTWDITLDSACNWTTRDDEDFYAAQSVANAWLQFRGETYFFPDDGIPHREEILGKKYPMPLLEEYLKRTALNVPKVVKCQIIEVSLADRTLTAIGIIYTENGGKYDVRI